MRAWSVILMDILLFPVWWYSRGARAMAGYLYRAVVFEARRLAIGLWIQNIFVPMYGQWNWQGRLVSFFMRVVQILGRSIFLCVWALLLICVFLLYTVLPLLCCIGIVWNI